MKLQRVLSLKMSGEDVKFLQTKLKELGFFNERIDSFFGQNTLVSVTNFQRAVNIKADGNVDTNTYITQAVPVGSVFHFASSTPPTGYLKANGDPIPNGVGEVQGVTANFSALYAILGSTYGAAGKLPDLRGQFIRSWADDGTTYDVGRGFGGTQADDFKSHNHLFGGDDQIGSQGGYTTTGSFQYDAISTPYGGGGGQNWITKNNTTNFGTTETRPRNVALLACIKY